MLERMWRKGRPPTLLVGMQIVIATMNKLSRFLNKLKIELPYYLAIQLVDIYPEKTIIERYMHPNIHCSAWLLTIVKAWK